MVFWYLLLAHLIADYPLQPTWMVLKKARWTVLTMHVAVHIIITVIILWKVRFEVWPYILALAGIHLALDVGKNQLGKARPNWVIGPYLADQFLHLLTILAIAILIREQAGELPLRTNPPWLILAIVFLLVTYVWYISERIFFYRQPQYRQEIIDNVWSRIAARGLFLTILLILWALITQPAAGLAVTLHLPYASRKYRERAFITDVLVSAAGLILFFTFI
jgi:hypothetical protein